MSKNITQKRQALESLAANQSGLFTTEQAVKIGFARQNHNRFIESGWWRRIARGIYGLDLQNSDDKLETYQLLTLFTKKRGGENCIVFSGETAASLHGIGDFFPVKVSCFLDKNNRKDLSEFDFLHITRLSDVNEKELSKKFGNIYVTSPMQTLVDLIIVYNRDFEEVRRAFVSGRNEGKIPNPLSSSALKRCSDDISNLFIKWEHSIND